MSSTLVSPIDPKNVFEKTIFNNDFLLHNQTALLLFHDYAKDLPIIDYHNHLPPDQIACNKKFTSITEVWLQYDHYKWRAMRGLGVDEKYITGQATDEEKFMAWATCFPEMVRNPLFHWSQMELKKPFGINEYLNKYSGPTIYKKCNEQLQHDSFSTQGILHQFKVEMVGTTDDPCDDLVAHQKIREDNIGITVLPSFRPDKIFKIDNRNLFLLYVEKLEIASGVKIHDIHSLLQALENRVNYFHDHGCRIADHGLSSMPPPSTLSTALEKEFENYLIADNSMLPFSQPDSFAGAVLMFLCSLYHKKGWVQQFHLGPLRDNNTRLLHLIGGDAGVDSIGDFSQAQSLSYFLNALDERGRLAKTILYNINPADNEVFATICGNFNGDTIKGKIQYGSGWWFLDQKDGIERQLNALSYMGTLSTFVGMITDSRSFLSYSRHEYFRRVLCNLIGDDMEKGLLPNDMKWMGTLVQNICYYNAKAYFNL
ncbi:MAG: glucuronate isomerase [Phycisphaerales bacterium]|nr:glucuronate isomerase [Phycisphaerales bacterium]